MAVPNVHVDDYLTLHEVEEAGHVLLRRHARNSISIVDQRFPFVFSIFSGIKVLQVINDADVVNVLATFTHEDMWRFLLGHGFGELFVEFRCSHSQTLLPEMAASECVVFDGFLDMVGILLNILFLIALLVEGKLSILNEEVSVFLPGHFLHELFRDFFLGLLIVEILLHLVLILFFLVGRQLDGEHKLLLQSFLFSLPLLLLQFLVGFPAHHTCG